MCPAAGNAWMLCPHVTPLPFGPKRHFKSLPCQEMSCAAEVGIEPTHTGTRNLLGANIPHGIGVDDENRTRFDVTVSGPQPDAYPFGFIHHACD
jgi:hypothetical protein